MALVGCCQACKVSFPKIPSACLNFVCRESGIRRVVMVDLLLAIWMLVCDLFKSQRRLRAENLFLRHQLNIALRRAPRRFRLSLRDRILLVWMTRVYPDLLGLAWVVKPETILRWHRAGFRAFWRWKSRKRAGRPKIDRALRDLIRRMSRENPLWGRASDPWRVVDSWVRCGSIDCVQIPGAR